MNRTSTRQTESGVCFEAPEGWIDKSMIAFSAPGAGAPGSSNLVITSESFREGDSLRTHMGRQVLEASRQLRDFDLLETRDGVLGGLPAVTARFTWTSHFGVLEQTITSVERVLNGVRVATSVTTTALTTQAEEARATFEAFLASMRFTEAYGSPSEIRPRAPTPSSPPAPSQPSEVLPPFIPMPGLGRLARGR
jgi:hypothetical protein